MEKRDLLRTYKFYDNQGRRVAIFGDYTNRKGWIDVKVVTCSLHDQFNKSTANHIYHGELDGHPQEFAVPVEEGENYKAAFMKWCHQNYQKPFYWFQSFNILSVRNGRKNRILSKRKTPIKMDMYNIH